MLQTYTGTVKWELGEVRTGNYGPYRSIAISMDDSNAPNAKDGVVRVYKDPEHRDIAYLETLGSGERVTLAWQPGSKGKSGYYTFLVDYAEDGGKDDAAGGQVVDRELPQRSYPVNSRIVVPLSPESVAAFIQMFEDRAALLLQGYEIVSRRVERMGLGLDQAAVQRLAATAFIETNRNWTPDTVLEEAVPEPAF